ncbi:MAG: hypothetical protein ACR2PH_11530, partial [Desulfobulbia bacterium]
FGAGQGGGKNVKWRAGPAVTKVGFDVAGYVEHFRDIEKDLGIEPFERIGDSRAFANENDDNIDRFAQYSEHDMHFVASDGRTESFGLGQLDDWFAYNEGAELDCDNHPKLHVHESCGNLIESLLNYNSEGTADEALKDPIDALRYFRTANGGEGPIHVASANLGFTRNNNGY